MDEKINVGKAAIFLYVQLISSMISGYIFFIILARITTTEIIGTFSLVLAVSEIFGNVAIIGMPDGIQRFLGKSFVQRKLGDATVYVKISFVFLLVGIIASSTVILVIKDWLSDVFGIGPDLIIVINLLIASYAVYTMLYSIVVASLKTSSLPIIIIISSGAKVIMAIMLVLSGAGIFGLALGYTFFGQIISSILLGLVITSLFKTTKKFSGSVVALKTASKNLLTAGVVAWIPVLITTLGIDLGTLILYGIHGSYQSGVYFVTIAILNAINAIIYAVFGIALPALSSMEDGRKRFAWKTIRLTSILLLPLTSAVIFYPEEIMQLIGTDYIAGSSSLQILLISTLPIIVLSGIETLVFSYGRYRQTLAINLAMNIPRTVLYFALVPAFGMIGVAISYTIGSAIGVIVSIIVERNIRIGIRWKTLFTAFFLSVLLAFMLSTSGVNYIVGIMSTIIVSYLIFMKLHIIEKSDGSFIISLFPQNISKMLITISNRFERVIDWFY